LRRKKFGGLNAILGALVVQTRILTKDFILMRKHQRQSLKSGVKELATPLASQYAKFGRYHLNSGEAEFLPDGRMLLEGSVFEPDEVEFVGRICW
jgi:hypothetical protein